MDFGSLVNRFLKIILLNITNLIHYQLCTMFISSAGAESDKFFASKDAILYYIFWITFICDNVFDK